MSDSSTRSPGSGSSALVHRLPRWAKITGIAATAIIVAGAVIIPVVATAVDRHDRQVAREHARTQAMADRAAESAAIRAAALETARGTAARLNADFDGFTVSLAGAVSPDAAAAFEDTRVRLALAIATGGVDEITAAVEALGDALARLVDDAASQAGALMDASPLADPTSRDALASAVADLARTDDAATALSHVKTASDAVVVAQAVGKAAADAAAARESAEADDSAIESGAGDGSSWSPSGGGALEPGITGMSPGDAIHCGALPPGEVVLYDFGWRAREGNTVDVFYALTESSAQATDGFQQIASVPGEHGSVSIPRTCPVGEAPTLYLTVKLVASTPSGSATAYYWGL